MFLKSCTLQMVRERSSEDYVAMNLPKGSNVIPLALASIILIGAVNKSKMIYEDTWIVNRPDNDLTVVAARSEMYVIRTPRQVNDSYTPQITIANQLNLPLLCPIHILLFLHSSNIYSSSSSSSICSSPGFPGKYTCALVSSATLREFCGI